MQQSSPLEPPTAPSAAPQVPPIAALPPSSNPGSVNQPGGARELATRRAGPEPWWLLGLVLLAHGLVLGPALDHPSLGASTAGPARALPKAMETRQIVLPGAAPVPAAVPEAAAVAQPTRAPGLRNTAGNPPGRRASPEAAERPARAAAADAAASAAIAQDSAAATSAAAAASAALTESAGAEAQPPRPGQPLDSTVAAPDQTAATTGLPALNDAALSAAAAVAPSVTATATAANANANANANADSPAVPTYATQIAAAFQLSYELRRGVLTGTGELRFKREGDAYELSLDGRVLGVEAISLASKGQLDAHGLAPERFTDRRRGRDRQAANFDRTGGRITYSGPSNHHNLAPGSQDRLSWMVQLPAVIEARPAQWLPGARIQLFVTGARGDADIWTFNVHERAALEWQGQMLPNVLRLTREPRKPYDTQVEVWLDPARLHLPVRARLTSLPGGDTLELELAPSAR